MFDRLKTGGYKVKFVAPDDFEFTTQAPRGAEVRNDDSDASATGVTRLIRLTKNEQQMKIDAGLVAVETDPGTASIGDTVWVDTNANGARDGGEPGAAGAMVRLLNGSNAVIATSLTDANGQYLFDNLSAGTYRVEFVAPSGYEFTTASGAAADAANDDSDANVTTGRTGTVDLSVGEAERDVDAGLVATNGGPTAVDDETELCADKTATVNVLGNDSDPDAQSLTITHVDGQAISEGQTITASDDVKITLSSGQLVFDPAGTSYANLTIGSHDEATYSYTVSDGAGGTDTANIDVEYCGAVNTLETIKASLPSTGTVSLTEDNSFGGEYYTTTISGTGDPRLDGESFEISYCLEQDVLTVFGVDIPVNIYLADAASIPSGTLARPQNLDLVNWILNQGFENLDNGDGTGSNYTEAEIQGAIWGLTDDFDWVPPSMGTRENAREIIALAQANGEGFSPGAGDIVGILLDPTDAAPSDHQQDTIFGVRFADLVEECLCA